MAISTFQKRKLLYYVFAAFIVAIFLWWWVLLFNKNERVYTEKLALYDLIIDIDDSETTMQLYNQEVAYLEQLHKDQKMMIGAEGLTFLILLIFGIIRLNRYFQKELELARQQSNFLLSITHELKSPLASALLNNQTLLKRQSLSEDKRQILLNNSNSELLRLEELVGKLLFAARLEGEKVEHEEQELNLSEIYSDLFQSYKERYNEQFNMTSNIDEGIFMSGDQVLASSIFTNLLDNAVKYCDEQGGISVDLLAHGNMAMLRVSNDGPQISTIDKENIWKKFYRVGDEQTRSSTGTGLGLYIVKRMVEAHAGKIGVFDKKEGGAIFEVELPRIDQG
ncbi:MAG: HAMP domain-containing histidine kinase [Bacteroidetes bacterium]|nr:HAMP domain-containing histidine kinase [Bacteroidota bacterium]